MPDDNNITEYTRQDYCEALRAFLELGNGMPDLHSYVPVLQALLTGLETGAKFDEWKG